jgi:hypothetical protein
MKRLGALLAGAALGGAAVYGGLNYHVLHTDSGHVLIPKRSATLAETYVDVRGFGLSDWYDHGELARAVVAADRGDLLGDSAADSVRDGLSSVFDRLED